MIYKVTIGWRCEFDFDDAIAAMMFAQSAAMHKKEGINNDIIRIEIIDSKEQDEEEEKEEEDGAV